VNTSVARVYDDVLRAALERRPDAADADVSLTVPFGDLRALVDAALRCEAQTNSSERLRNALRITTEQLRQIASRLEREAG
jgi:hypothetical protein